MLANADEPLSVTDLAIEVADLNPTTDGIGADCQRVRRLRQTLSQWYLPALAQVDGINYDPGRGTVSLSQPLEDDDTLHKSLNWAPE